MAMKMKKRGPTKGRIARAVTQEVSIVTDPANGEEFIVKNKEGQAAGEVTNGLAKRMAEMGFQFTNDEEETAQDNVEGTAKSGVNQEGESASDDNGLNGFETDIAKLFAGIADLEIKLNQQPDAEETAKKGVKKKTQRPQLLKLMNDMVEKLVEVLTEAGFIAENAAAQVPEMTAERDKNKRTIGGQVAGPAQGGQLPRPEGETAPEPLPEGANLADMSKGEQEGNAASMVAAQGINSASIQKLIEDAVSKALSGNKGEAGDGDASDAAADDAEEDGEGSEPSRDESNAPEVTTKGSEEIEKLKQQIEETNRAIEAEKAAMVQEEQAKAFNEELAKLREQQSEQAAELDRLKKLRLGSNALDVNDADTAPERGSEQDDFRKDSQGTILSRYGNAFRQIHKARIKNI